MNYVLLILLFVTPPNSIQSADKGTPNDHRIWALQTAVSMEVSSREWCQNLADGIDASISGTKDFKRNKDPTKNIGVLGTATVTTRIFCIPKDEKDLVSSLAKGARSFSDIKVSPESLRDKILEQITVSPPK
jgi:hypothetical protein